MESTYGNRTHASILEAEAALAEMVIKTTSRGGKVLIPAFPQGTQEVVYSLHKLADAGKIPKLQIYVDSPLSVNVTSVFRKHLDLLDEETQNSFYRSMQILLDLKGSNTLKVWKSPRHSITIKGLVSSLLLPNGGAWTHFTSPQKFH